MIPGRWYYNSPSWGGVFFCRNMIVYSVGCEHSHGANSSQLASAR